MAQATCLAARKCCGPPGAARLYGADALREGRWAERCIAPISRTGVQLGWNQRTSDKNPQCPLDQERGHCLPRKTVRYLWPLLGCEREPVLDQSGVRGRYTFWTGFPLTPGAAASKRNIVGRPFRCWRLSVVLSLQRCPPNLHCRHFVLFRPRTNNKRLQTIR